MTHQTAARAETDLANPVNQPFASRVQTTNSFNRLSGLIPGQSSLILASTTALTTGFVVAYQEKDWSKARQAIVDAILPGNQARRQGDFCGNIAENVAVLTSAITTGAVTLLAQPEANPLAIPIGVGSGIVAGQASAGATEAICKYVSSKTVFRP